MLDSHNVWLKWDMCHPHRLVRECRNAALSRGGRAPLFTDAPPPDFFRFGGFLQSLASASPTSTTAVRPLPAGPRQPPVEAVAPVPACSDGRAFAAEAFE